MMNPDRTATLDRTLQADDLQLWLNRVSRTFALTIRMLEEPFQTYAAAAYLLCRIVDTVEDCETLSPELKCRYLRDFSARLKGSGSGRGVAPVALFDAPATWEERLTLYESGVLDLIGGFPFPIQDIIFRYAVEMAEGMALFLEQQDEHGYLHFETDEQLDRYCYYVAGTVGLMLNELYASICGLDKSASRDAAIELGIGLQLTNIVKDIQKDVSRNIHYCPTKQNRHWPEASASESGDDPRRELFCLASATISHLTGGKEYILNLESNSKQYKRFCVTNYLMAWKTLETCVRNPRQTANGSGAKISRFRVYKTVLESHGCVLSDGYLNWRADRLRRNCTSLVRASAG